MESEPPNNCKRNAMKNKAANDIAAAPANNPRLTIVRFVVELFLIKYFVVWFVGNVSISNFILLALFLFGKSASWF